MYNSGKKNLSRDRDIIGNINFGLLTFLYK